MNHRTDRARDPAPSGHPAFRRRGLLLASCAAVTGALGRPHLAAGADPRPPNIVYIVADDLGWKDVGFHGADISTPNLDALARTGAELSAFYVQPMCTPTRAAFLTGRYPLRYGLQTGVIPSGGIYGLATDEWLLPQALQAAGYRTALIGKWHLGHAEQKYWPRQRGFDSFYGALVGEIDHFKKQAHGRGDWYRDNAAIEEPGYDTTLFGDAAVRLIETHDPATPLFLYLAFTAPHTPYQAPAEYLERQARIADPNRRAYAAMITAMDDQIGRVVAALEARGLRENTLIVFHSDNGGTRSAKLTGESAVTGALPPDNGPYRDGKGSLYEGGTRVVALANWPGHIKPGTVDGMLHVTDMYPTLVGLAGGSLAKAKPLDGRDAWGTISAGAASPRTELVYNIDPFLGAVRQGDWKLVWTALLPGKLELFNLAADPAEQHDLAATEPARVAALRARIAALAGEMAPPLLFPDVFRTVLSAPPSTPLEIVAGME